jgi:hypothetical protein
MSSHPSQASTCQVSLDHGADMTPRIGRLTKSIFGYTGVHGNASRLFHNSIGGAISRGNCQPQTDVTSCKKRVLENFFTQ